MAMLQNPPNQYTNPNEPEPKYPEKIIDHTMASRVDESTYKVVTRTNTFQPSDSHAYSWISLSNVNEAHNVDWNWYAPNGSLYKQLSQNIPKSSKGPWEWYNVYTYINIAGDQPANMPGIWHVDILLDGQKILTDQFTLLSGNSLGIRTDLVGPMYNL
jgi:hypothetical protein